MPALDGEEYLELANPAAMAFCPLMRIPPDRQAEFKAKWYKQLAGMDVSDFQRYLLIDCVEAYLQLDADQEKVFAELLQKPQFENGRNIVDGILERYVEGVEDGRAEGREEGQRSLLQAQIEKKFGPLLPSAREQLEAWPRDQLLDLADSILTAKSLAELGFTERPNGDS